MGFSFIEIALAFLGLLGGLGVPLASPPGEEDARMLAVAPERCVLYYSWSPTVEPVADKNPSEALLCRPTVKHFREKIRKVAKLSLSGRVDGSSEFVLNHQLVVSLLEAVEDQPGAIYCRSVKRGDGGDGQIIDSIEGGVVLRLKKNTAELRQQFVNQLQGITPANSTTNNFELSVEDVGGQTALRLKRTSSIISGFEFNEVWVCLVDDLLQLATSKEELRSLQANLKTPPPAWLKSLRDELKVDRVSTTSYFDWNSVHDEFGPFFRTALWGDDSIWNETLTGFQRSASVSGYDDQGFLNQTRLTIDPKSPGLFSLVDPRGLKIEKLDWLHKDRLIGIALPMNAKKTYQMIERIANGVKAQAGFEQAMNDFEKFSGNSLKDEVISSLGDLVTFQYGLENADPFSWRVDIEIAEEMSFPDVLDQVSKKLTDIAGETLRGQVLTTEVDGRTIYQYESPERWQKKVSWGFHIDRLMIGSNEQIAAVQFAPDVQMVNAALMQNIFQLAKKRGWGKPVALSQFNFAGAIRKYRAFYDSFRDMEAPLFGNEAEFSFNDLPSSEEITKDVSPNVSVMYYRKDGLVLMQRSTYPSNSLVGSVATLMLGALPSWFVD